MPHRLPHCLVITFGNHARRLRFEFVRVPAQHFRAEGFRQPSTVTRDTLAQRMGHQRQYTISRDVSDA